MSVPLRSVLKNVTNGKKTVKAWLDEYTINAQFTDDRIKQLLAYQPSGKANNVEYMVIRKDEYNQRTLYFKNADSVDEDSISWNKCVENLFGRYNCTSADKKERLKAFRNAIHDVFQCEFKQSHTVNGVGVCTHCGASCGSNTDRPLHVDHVDTSFNKLLQLFLESERVELAQVTIRQVGMEPYLSDSTMLDRWRDWHNSRVTYRILCKHCNESFGDKSCS